MALRYSLGLRNRLAGGQPSRHVASITAATIAAVDGGGGNDSFTDSGNGFVTAGFEVGDAILAIGFTGGMAGIIGPFTLLTVAAGAMEVATGLLADDAEGESVTLVVVTGGSLKEIFKDGVLKIYSGNQPASPNDAFTGTLLATITRDGGAFVPGAVANGLEFGEAAAGAIAKRGTWTGTIAVSGIAGWFRLYANTLDAGGADAIGTYCRIDGSVGTSGSQLDLSTTNLVAGAPLTIDTFSLSVPEDQS